MRILLVEDEHYAAKRLENFTTAYDEYALNAFKVNSIDYLLKPIEESALCQAINKYQKFFPSSNSNEFNWGVITKDIFQPKNHYKQRFLVKNGTAYAYLNISDIALIYSEDGLSFALNEMGKRILLDNSLDKIESTLDPSAFFRISRKHLVALTNINQVHPYLNNRLKVELKVNNEETLVVSREKVKDFKGWLDS